MLPGADPVAGLVRQLAIAAQQLGLDWTVARLHHQLDEIGLTGLADELLLVARARRLLIVVDQFEELLTQAPPEQRARFARLLHPALSGPVQVVATLRPEFMDQLLLDSDLAVLPTRTYTVRPLCREALRAVIEGPARLAGIAVAEELVARLVADTDSGEALPLLAFTLAQLGDGVGRGGRLSAARYDQLGGVRGALTRQADAALAEASAVTGRRREQVIAGLLHLVTVDEHGHPTRWRVLRDELTERVIREVDAFIARRLVTTDIDNDHVVVGVAHEAFLSAWSPLVQAIQANVSALRARRAIEQAAAEWDDGGRLPARLWEHERLAAAMADTGAHLQAHDLVADRVDLSPTARAFLRTSIYRDRFRRGRALAVLSVLLVLAVGAAVVAFVQQRIASEQRTVAVSRQVAAEAMELRAVNPALAAQLGLAAYRLAPTTEARGSLLSTLINPYSTRLIGHTTDVMSVAFSRDGHTLATGSIDKTVRLWDVSDPHKPSPLATLTGHTSGVIGVAFSSAGRTLATGSIDKTVRLWDVSDPRHPNPMATLTGHSNDVIDLAFSPDDATLATGSTDHTARLWDVSDARKPSPLATLSGHTSSLSSVAFSPDGQTLATTSYDNTARLWDVSDPRQPHLLITLTGHTNALSSVAFSPDGRTLTTGSYDNSARLWDLPGPVVAGHTGAVYSVAFSRDGHTLATASRDRTARLWDVSDPRRPNLLGTLTGHTSDVSSVDFSPDGRTLVTGSVDKTARLWDVSNPRHPSALATLTGHTNEVVGVAFSPNGRTVATASRDSTARLWDVSDPRQPSPLATLSGHTNEVSRVVFSPDGRAVATTSYDKTTRLWNVGDPRHPSPLASLTGHANGVCDVVFSPDGHTVATTSYDNTARLWDVNDLHHPHPLATLTGHTDNVLGAAFSPDGHTLATTSYDNTARLWDVNDERVAARICDSMPAITKSDWDQYLPGLSYQSPCQ
jgi:WD40 repeat protein